MWTRRSSKHPRIGDNLCQVELSEIVAGSLLEEARIRAGLSQAELAARAGISQPDVSAYETGRRQPSIPTLSKLLAAAGFELRTRLEPLDDHDEVIARWEAARPDAEVAEWRRQQAAAAARASEL